MTYYKNSRSKDPHELYIGRFAPLHKGHTWIIEKKLKENLNSSILILVRDTEFDELPVEKRAEIVKTWMIHNNIKGIIEIIPDINNVNYGRNVGYGIIEHEPPENIKTISATKIREMIKNNDNSWKSIVAKGTAEITEKFYKEILND